MKILVSYCHWSVFLVKTRLHNLYLFQFFHLYEGTDPHIYSAGITEIF